MTSISMDEAWLARLTNIMCLGEEVSPRGQKTRELISSRTVVDMRRPVLTLPERKLNYQFMAAEAYWILVGDNRVAGIAPWNKHIAQFSDDGETFAGAYGPKIRNQLGWVVTQLLKDQDTRQAVLTIWERNPAPSKDIPCTVAFQFLIRQDRLHVLATMRSSDVWLGLPYDCFNFSMLGLEVCRQLRLAGLRTLEPGLLYLTAGSSHLYERNWLEAEACMPVRPKETPKVPQDIWDGTSVSVLEMLGHLRDTKKGDPLRWWERAV